MSRSLSITRYQAALGTSISPRAATSPVLVPSISLRQRSPPCLRTQSPCSSIASRQNLHTDSKSVFLSHNTTSSTQSPRRGSTISVQRRYHSASDPEPPPTSVAYSPEQIAILSATLSHVPTHGFSTHALTLGAKDAGYLEASLQLFPRGGEAELVMYWLASRREELRRRVEAGEIFKAEEDGKTEGNGGQSTAGGVQKDSLSLEKKVRTLITERLKMNEKIIGHWQDALAIMSLPSNVPASVCELYALSSDILYLAGDDSIDASWYAKRMSVATVYASSEVFMTEDKSQDFGSTFEFVDRRIKDANSVVDTAGHIKKYLGYVAGSVIGAGRSYGMKI